jgi:subtilisin family serine protease
VGGRVRSAVAASLLLLLLAPVAAWAAGDPYRDQQWALDTLGVDEAWEVSRGAGAVVAVIDTGVDVRHPDLRDRVLRDDDGEVVGVDLVDGGTPDDEHGHGTLVAGVIAATEGNGEGIAGVAPEASIMPIRVLDDVGAGQGKHVDAGIRWAVDNGADVINLSLESVKKEDGSSVGPGAPTEAVRYAWQQGVVVIAASGNNGSSVSDYPDDSPVLLVGATDEEDRPTHFSDHGRADAVLAPGVGIVSTWCRGPQESGCSGSTHNYGVAEGTSFAAPHVAGIAAMLAAEGHSANEIVKRIRATAVDVGDRAHGHGRVDAAAALRTSGEVVAPPAGEGEGRLVAASDQLDETPSRPPADPQPAPEPAPAPEPVPAPDPEPAEDPGPAAEVDAEGDAEAAEPEPDPEPDHLVQTPSEPDDDLGRQAVGVPVDGSGAAGEVVLQLFAAGLVGTSLAMWSAAARREV